MFEINKTLIEIIESWKEKKQTLFSMEEILAWVDEKNRKLKVKIDKIPFEENSEWKYRKQKGGLSNSKGTFFTIVGATQQEAGYYYEQPIIVQNEIGYLGILCKKINGILYFLMQAKIEPGNINKIQISPTIQATKSNFMQAHGGKIPAYLEYFADAHCYEVIVDQIQSEQASRFLGKRNRNIIIKIDDDIDVLDSHKWMTLGQIKELMKIDNLVNMDTRTVISCIPFALREYEYKELLYIQSLFNSNHFFNSVFGSSDHTSLNRVYQYLNDYKMLNRKKICMVDLHNLKEWTLKDDREYCSSSGEFKIIYCNIAIEGREVQCWQQPLLEACGKSVFGLIYRRKNEKLEFLVQSVSEIGCFDGIELGPSVQLGPKHIETTNNPVDLFFIDKLRKKSGIRFSGLFSEEGGRFYHEQNQNILLEIESNEMDCLLSRGGGIFGLIFIH